jgi:hypothetical protein
MDINKLNFILITSTGRTGTNWLGRYLGSITDSYSVHEPDTFNIRTPLVNFKRLKDVGINTFIIGKLNNSLGSRNINTNYLNNKISQQTAFSMYLRSRRFLRKLPDNIRYVEANPQLFGMIEVFAKYFEKFKSVILVRDPRTWVRSNLRKEQLFNKRDLVLKLGLNRYDPTKGQNLISFEKLLGYWKNVNTILLNQAIYSDSLVLKYEDVFFNNRVGLMMLIKFINPSYKTDEIGDIILNRVNKVEYNQFPDWPEWNEFYVKKMHNICGDMMQELDYGKEPLWLEKVAKVTSNEK